MNLFTTAFDRLLEDKYFPIASEIVGVFLVSHSIKNLSLHACNYMWNAGLEPDPSLTLSENVVNLKRGFKHLLPLYTITSVATITSLWLLSRPER